MHGHLLWNVKEVTKYIDRKQCVCVGRGGEGGGAEMLPENLEAWKNIAVQNGIISPAKWYFWQDYII